MKNNLLYVAVLGVILALVLLLKTYSVEPFESFSLKFNDVNFELQDKEPNKNIVFVAVDEKSVNEYGRWPWKREIVAQAMDNLVDADVVLMDMIFSEYTNETSDNRLADSIANLNASVCGFFLRQKSTQQIDEEDIEILADSALDLLQSQVSEFQNPQFISAPFAEMNIKPIMEACTLSGTFSTLAGADHLLREYPLSFYFADTLYPSLAMQGLRIKFDSDMQRVGHDKIAISDYTIGVNDRGFVRLNYYKREQYKIVSIKDVIEGKLEEGFFKDKIVILGITEIGAGDVVSTPIGSLYGPLLHYTFISNLLEGHIIKEPASIAEILIISMVLIPFILFLLISKIMSRSILYVLYYLLAYGVVRYLFVTDMLYIDMFYPLVAIILSVVAIEVIAFNRQEKDGKFIKDAFSNYLSGDLLDELIENPESLSLGGESKELSILFSDIRGFTTISESMTAVELISLMNRYFTPMTNSVIDHRGMLDKYIGDAVMAFFNAPVNVDDHADAACRTALDMIEKLGELNKDLEKEGIPNIKIGIGVNTAEVVVGNMGSDTRFNYTVVGDGVNLASRVEGLTKNYGVSILITEFTVAQLDYEFLYRKIEPVKVKGKDEAVMLFELMAETEVNQKLHTLYNEALEIYEAGDLENAKELFSKLAEEHEDPVSEYFIARIKEGQTWGIHVMKTK